MNKKITVKDITSGNIRALAKAITLIESTNPEHRKLANTLLVETLPKSKENKSIRIGITGTPGVGKSTFIEVFGLHLISLGKKVAVLTIDPSSPISGGSILGDKTRMEKLSQNDMAYIRPSAAGTNLGGVAGKTREAMYLCEAAGFDIVLVETVGVGQSEHEVSSMVDFFAVLSLPNSGDELQGIKKGILELADLIIINKADGDGLNQSIKSQAGFEGALGLISPTSFWIPKVLSVSALYNKNINGVWENINEYYSQAISNGELYSKRNKQNLSWLKQLTFDLLQQQIFSNPKNIKLWNSLENQVIDEKTTVYLAAKKFIDQIY